MKTLIFGLLTALPLQAWAGKVTIEARVDNTNVGVGEQFPLEVTVTVEGQGDAEYSPPPFEGLDVLSRGTQHSQSFVMSFGNGPKVTSSTTYSYILSARQAGKASIGQAKARVGSDEALSDAIAIEAGGSGATAAAPSPRGSARQNPQSQPAPQSPMPSPQANDSRGEAVLLRVVPDKTEAYVGEQVVLSVFLLSRVELSDIQNLTQPQLEGLLLERDDRPRKNLTPRLQRINGVEYQVFEVARFALFALREGPLSIGSFVADAQGAYTFFSQPRTYHVSSPAEQITAKALPAQGRPGAFTGLNVGRYSFTAQLLSPNTEVGKPVTLRLVVSGAGNISKLELPKLQIQPPLRAFDPETKVERRFDQGMLTGRIQRDYLIVPNAPGQFTLPPLAFDYFDPATGQFHEDKSPPLTFSVSGEAGHGARDVGPHTEPDSSKRLMPPRIASVLHDDRFFGEGPVWIYGGSGALLASALASAVVVLRRREKTPADTTRGARGKAQKRLRALRSVRDNPRELYAELQRILGDFLSQRFAISPGASRESMRTRLVERGAPEGIVEQLLSELDNCDFARFAPGADRASAADAALARSEQLIVTLDKTV